MQTNSFSFPLAPGKNGSFCDGSLLFLNLYCPPNKTIDMGPHIFYFFLQSCIIHALHGIIVTNRSSLSFASTLSRSIRAEVKMPKFIKPSSHRTMALFIKAYVSQSYNNVRYKSVIAWATYTECM